MDPQHLERDELSYELVIRRISSDAHDWFNQLQTFLLAEAEGTVEEPLDMARLTRSTISKEIRECDLKLKEIGNKLNEAMRDEDDALILKSKSRMIHIAGRIKRLMTYDPSCVEVFNLYTLVQEMGKQMSTAQDVLGDDSLGAMSLPEDSSDRRESQFLQKSTEPKPIGASSTGTLPKIKLPQELQPSRQGRPLSRSSVTNAEALEAFQSTTRDDLHQPLPAKQNDMSANNQNQHGLWLEMPTTTNKRSQPMANRVRQLFEVADTRSNHLQVGQNYNGSDCGHKQATLSANRQQFNHHSPANHSNRGMTGGQHNTQYAVGPQTSRSFNNADRGLLAEEQRSTFANQSSRGLAGGHVIHKWSIRFDGVSGSLSAEDFIYRAERQAQLYGVSERALALGVGDLMTGRAGQWFWTYQQQMPNATWAELKAAFLRRYAPHKESDYEIRSRIENRKQKENESFNEFCQDVEALAVRLLRRMPEDELVEVLRRNMLMHLRKALWRHETFTVDELVSVCCEYEELCKDEERLTARQRHRVNEVAYQEPSRAGWHAVHSEYREPVSAHTQFTQEPLHEHFPQYYPGVTRAPMPYAGFNQPYSEATYDQRYAEPNTNFTMAPNYMSGPQEHIEAIKSEPNRGDYVVCWNCCEMGHVFTNCSKPQMRVFCYTCGMHDKLTVTCPRCSLNLRKGKTQSGATCPPKSNPYPSNQILMNTMPTAQPQSQSILPARK